MKTKTEAKRQAIVQAAAEVFREVGFERASMSEIRARVGGSKATLYNYFPSKEKLFFEVMYQATETELGAITATLDPDAADVTQELLRFGQKLLPVLYSPEAIALRRLAIAESAQSDIGKLVFEGSALPIEKRLTEFLRRAMKRGSLRSADAKIAAMQLLSLLESELLQRMLFGVEISVKPDALRASVRRAVEAFLSGYQRG
ncbi:MAG TPA: TetR/AcrR family transcriptional regulator [Steroidobacteraceae bacterium]|nr:TetR/AcrR family transcriptional regulator [Steroidobacteraceae bacterium]